MIETYRVIIKRETQKYLIGKTYSNKKYKIFKNEYINKLYVGSDSYFYAKKVKNFFCDILIPVSDKEASVINY
ncbi:hypothetical protein [Clostridium cuniculi]|uniref:hypothetical protein n=1 Tax=Clostridium cuniculi TaxID=2548455 RepID=UPI0018AC2598|nr:hypothetical protein [Clostridium cuniculi]